MTEPQPQDIEGNTLPVRTISYKNARRVFGLSEQTFRRMAAGGKVRAYGEQDLFEDTWARSYRPSLPNRMNNRKRRPRDPRTTH